MGVRWYAYWSYRILWNYFVRYNYGRGLLRERGWLRGRKSVSATRTQTQNFLITSVRMGFLSNFTQINFPYLSSTCKDTSWKYLDSIAVGSRLPKKQASMMKDSVCYNGESGLRYERGRVAVCHWWPYAHSVRYLPCSQLSWPSAMIV